MLTGHYRNHPQGSGADDPKTIQDQAYSLWVQIQTAVGQSPESLANNRRIIFESWTPEEVTREAGSRLADVRARASAPMEAWAGGPVHALQSIYAQGVLALGWVFASIARGQPGPDAWELATSMLALVRRMESLARAEVERLNRRIEELENRDWFDRAVDAALKMLEAMGKAVKTGLSPVGGAPGIAGGILIVVAGLAAAYVLSRRPAQRQ